MNVGILGGTFDPIHLGHLAAAEAALACAGLERVLLMPAAQPPHKDDPHASAEDRVAMCRLAVEDRPGLEVSDLELRRPGPSYTVDTLTAFAAERPGDRPFLILGWDAAREMRTWKQPEHVLELADVVLFSRPTLPTPLEADLVAAGFQLARVTLCTDITPDIRATDVRRLAAEGESLRGLVPPEVERYIREHHLYGSRGATP